MLFISRCIYFYVFLIYIIFFLNEQVSSLSSRWWGTAKPVVSLCQIVPAPGHGGKTGGFWCSISPISLRSAGSGGS